MPPAIPALIAAIGTTAVAYIQGALIATLFTTFAQSFIVFAALGALSQALTKKPNTQSAATAEARGRMQTVRSSIEPRRIIFGRVMVSGPLVYMEVSGSADEYLHFIVCLAGHEVHSVQAVFFDDTQVGSRDANGNVTSGKYNGLARVRPALGTTSQTADALLTAESAGKWTGLDKLSGVANVYARLKRDDNVYATGAPQVRCIVRGLMVYDPRDAGTRYTENPALLLRWYLIAPLGLACATGEIDEASFIAAANACDERVAVTSTGFTTVGANSTTDLFTLTSGTDVRIATGDAVTVTSTGTIPAPLAAATNYYVIRETPSTMRLASTYQNALEGIYIDLTNNGSGSISFTHTNQPRYTCNGTVTLDMTPRDICSQLLQAMMGALTFTAGKYVCTAGVWTTPTITLTGDDLRGPVTLRERTPRQELFNGVRGTYMDPQKFWQPTDFPPIRNSTYVTEDGGAEIFRDIEFPMVANVIRAQRLAKLTLARARKSRILTLQCNLRALRVGAWDTVYVTIPALNMSAEPHRVINWKLTGEDGTVGVDLVLQAEDSNVYGWSASDATVYIEAPALYVPPLPYQGGGVPAGTALPGAGSEGDMYSLTTNGKIYRYFGGAWVTWTDGSDILAASITAGRLAVNSIVAGDGVIGDLAVGTLQIANQAVTIPTAAYTSGGASVGASYTTVQTITVVSTGAPILLTGSLSMVSNTTAGPEVGRMRLVRNGTVISGQYECGRGFLTVSSYEVRGAICAQMLDTPGAGTHTYTMEALCTAGASVSARSLSALEVKK